MSRALGLALLALGAFASLTGCAADEAATDDAPVTSEEPIVGAAAAKPGTTFSLTLNGAAVAVDVADPDGWNPAAGHATGPNGLIDVVAYVHGPNAKGEGVIERESVAIRIEPEATGVFRCADFGDAPGGVFYSHTRARSDVNAPDNGTWLLWEAYDTRDETPDCAVEITESGGVGGWVAGKARGVLERRTTDGATNPTLPEKVPFTVEFRVPRIQ